MPLILNGDTGISGVDGSAGTPSYQGNDSNTGVFFPAADTIAFAEGGVEVARFDSSGNLGIGNIPSAWGSTHKAIQLGSGSNQGAIVGQTNTNAISIVSNGFFNGTNWIYGNSVPSGLYTISQNQHIWYNATTGTAGNAISYVENMRIDSSGNVGIGTSSPSSFAKLAVNTATLGSQQSDGVFIAVNGTARGGLLATGSPYTYAGASANALWLYSGTSPLLLGPDGGAHVAVVTNGSERLRINSSGTLLINTTSTSNVNGSAPRLAVNGGINVTSGVTQTPLFQQGILTNDSGGNNGYWQYLGRFSGNQGGAICHIRYFYHVGFNANNGQNGIVDIFFKTANGTSSQAGSTGPFFGDGQYFKLGPQSLNAVRVIQQPNNTDYDIYTQIGNFSFQSFYTVTTSGGTFWTDVGTGSTSAPTGNFITLTANNITYT